jgi:hypothetical protein
MAMEAPATTENGPVGAGTVSANAGVDSSVKSASADPRTTVSPPSTITLSRPLVDPLWQCGSDAFGGGPER